MSDSTQHEATMVARTATLISAILVLVADIVAGYLPR